jgi:hypothetical protein
MLFVLEAIQVTLLTAILGGITSGVTATLVTTRARVIVSLFASAWVANNLDARNSRRTKSKQEG